MVMFSWFYFSFLALMLLSWRCSFKFKHFKNTNIPSLRLFLVVLLTLVILSQCEYMKLCIFTSVCMTHACSCCLSTSAWIFLWGFGFAFWAPYFASLNQRLLLQPRLFACCGVRFLSKPELWWNVFCGAFFSFQSVLKGFLHLTSLVCLLPPLEFILPSLCLLV